MTKLLAAISANLPSLDLASRVQRTLVMTGILAAYFIVPVAFAAWMLAL